MLRGLAGSRAFFLQTPRRAMKSNEVNPGYHSGRPWGEGRGCGGRSEEAYAYPSYGARVLCRRRAQVPILGDQPQAELPGQPKIRGIIDRQVFPIRQQERFGKRDLHLLNLHPPQERVRFQERGPLFWITPELLPTDIGNLRYKESAQSGLNRRAALQPAVPLALQKAQRR